MGAVFSFSPVMDTHDLPKNPRKLFFPKIRRTVFAGCVVRDDPVAGHLTYMIYASTCADEAENKAGDIVDNKWNEAITRIRLSPTFSPAFVGAYLYQIEQQPWIRRALYLATVYENKVYFHDTEIQMNDALANGATRVHVSISVDTLFDN
jgi:hypothetical protein